MTAGAELGTVDEAIAVGKTHLVVTCRTCRVLRHVPWALLPSVFGSARLGDIRRRLRCAKCGTAADPDDVKAGRPGHTDV